MKRATRFMKRLVITLVLITGMVCIIGTGGGGSGGGGDQNNDASLTHNEMLNALGVDTEFGKRKNPTGEPVSDEYNPTLRGITQLAKRSEIFSAGTRGQGGNAFWTPGNQYHTVLDWPDNAIDFETDNIPGIDDWLNLPKAMASGDLNGDGVDEIFIAYLRTDIQSGLDKELAFRVIKREQGVYSIIAEDVVAAYSDADISNYPTQYWWLNNFGPIYKNEECVTVSVTTLC